MRTHTLLSVLAVAASCICSTTAFTSLPRFQSQKFEIESRIVGGQESSGTEAPYIVSLSVSNLVYAHFCAGNIISREWILTAAHCLHDLRDQGGAAIGMAVYAGLRNRSQPAEAQVRYVDFAFAHKEFAGKEGSDDIALLHVSQPFTFNANVKPIALPPRNENYLGECKAYGWGLQKADGTQYSKLLQVNKADVMNASECQQALPSGAPVSGRHVCARVSACYGDGGSPLVKEGPGDFAELIGIGSFGYVPCGYRALPTVYTAVAKYPGWIAEVQWAYYILH